MLVVSEFFTSDELSELNYIIDNSNYFKELNGGQVIPGFTLNHPEVKKCKAYVKLEELFERGMNFQITDHNDVHRDTLAFPHDDMDRYGGLDQLYEYPGIVLKFGVPIGKHGVKVKDGLKLEADSNVTVRFGDLIIFNPTLRHNYGFFNRFEMYLMRVIWKLNRSLAKRVVNYFHSANRLTFFGTVNHNGFSQANNVKLFLGQNLARQEKQNAMAEI